MDGREVYGNSDDIAIIGMAARFPGARDAEEFWRNLRDGVESIKFFSDEELIAAGVDASLLSNPNYVKAKGVLDGVELFDASFFDISPGDAELLSPQQRFFLEGAWEALENAGYNPERYKGRIGVFAGESLNTYSFFNLYENRDVIRRVGFYQAALASDRDYLTTRVSYKLNLKGPSVNVQTACSTSLVAVHLAVQSLLNGECGMALAGAVSIIVPQKAGYLYEEGMIYSPDGHCRAFDAKANGTVNGSGLGIVVLKSLPDALADGDYIHAIIKGSAINNDGSLKAGYTAPGLKGQADVITEAINMAGIDASAISYVEAHGTGTILGDPIEIQALTEAFRASTANKGFCAIGSVKTNIGHLDVASGIAGLIKTAQALKYKALPPSLHFVSPNPEIAFDNSPFYVNTNHCEWKSEAAPRRAGVSSFGIGGTNAHVIVEESPARQANEKSRPWQLIMLSAKTRSALEMVTSNLVDHFEQNTDLNLPDVAYTLQVGRKAFSHRRMLVSNSVADALDALGGMDLERVFTRFEKPGYRPVAFMFPGQGTQYVNMSAGLYRDEATFREEIDRCSDLLKRHLKLDLRALLYPPDGQVEEAKRKLDQTFITQPALFAVEYALARLWMKWGVRPAAMIGHSIGEYVAACLAGVFSLEDALALVAARGRLMQSLPSGSMLSVTLPETDLLARLGKSLSLAAVNGPSRCAVAGPTELINEFQKQLEEQGVDGRRLSTSHAFHSSMMDPIIREFVEEVKRVELKPPQIRFISNVSGTWITADEATDPAYWARHLRQPVRFERGINELLKEPNQVLLEVGPGQSLSSLAKRHPSKSDAHLVYSSLRHPENRQPDEAFLLKTLGSLWMGGIEPDWGAFYEDEPRHRAPLPTYPFERARYWVEPGKPSYERQVLSGERLPAEEWFYTLLWKQTMPLAPLKAVDIAGQSLSWLLFVDQCGLGSSLAHRLRQHGQEVAIVEAGESFGRVDERSYTINPRSRDDYSLLLEHLRPPSETALMIAHLWPVTAGDDAAAGESQPASHVDLSFFSLLYLAQALGKSDVTRSAKITVVSSNMQMIAGEKTSHPEKATLLGVCKVMPQEYPNITCRSIDISVNNLDAWRTGKMADCLIAEMIADLPDKSVAYRGDTRWIQTVERIKPGDSAEDLLPLRDRGVYLITGGLGGIGLELARFLARVAHVRLVLTGRSTFPHRKEWAQWLSSHDSSDAVSQKVRTLEAIERSGSQILALTADITDEGQLREAIKRVREQWGEINGVIHAAGVAGGGMMQFKTYDAAADVLAPKVAGTRVLEKVLEGTTLDYFVLCSSLNSIIGGPGQVDYCAANAFLDAFAHSNTAKKGALTVSINWDRWREVGMAVGPPRLVLPDEDGLAYESIDHPLFDKRAVESANRQTLVTEFSTSKHWVLDEHRIVGNPVIPGTAYLEMARAALQQQGEDGSVEISDVFFITPLRVRDGETRQVYTVLDGQPGEFKFLMKSRDDSGSPSRQPWQEHAIGKVSYAQASPPKKYDIAEIIERCDERRIEAPKVYPEDDGPRWRTLRAAYIGRRELLMSLELAEEFSGDLYHLKLHPALLDVATGIAKHYLGAGAYYLPLSYKRLVMKKPLSRTIYSYVRCKGDENSDKETMSFDITILNETGLELLEIEEFTVKRVNEVTARIKEWAGADSRFNGHGRRAGAATLKSGQSLDEHAKSIRTLSEEGLLSEEGVDVFRRILGGNNFPQVAVSTKDLPGLIQEMYSLTVVGVSERADDPAASGPVSLYPRPEIETAYVAPRDEMEQSLAKIWQETLRIESVGAYDNFFELGGDSILGIQIIAKANKIGIQLTAQQFFQHQTIAVLAEAARSNLDANPPVPTQPFPLTPYQQALIEQGQQEPHRHSGALLLEAAQGMNRALLERAFQHVIARHDALRLRFERTENGWQQISTEPTEEMLLSTISLSKIEAGDDEAAVKAIARSLQESLNLIDGPVMRVALLQSESAKPSRLLLVIHDLAIDDFSWRILLQDLQAAYDQLSRGETIRPRTTSFALGVHHLLKRAESGLPADELDYWLADRWMNATAPALDSPVGNGNNASPAPMARILRVSLSAEETQALMEAAETYKAQVIDVLVTALAQSLSLQTGARSLRFELEGDWRSHPAKDLDLSQTLGQFKYTFPVLLDPIKAFNPAGELKAVKEHLRRVPGQGLNYSLLTFAGIETSVSKRLSAMPGPQVRFRYLGSVDDLLTNSRLWTSARKLDRLAGNRVVHTHLLEVNASIAEGRLQTDWICGERRYADCAIEDLSSGYINALRQLIIESQKADIDSYTPSDFPLAGLDERKFNKLFAQIKGIKRS